jgi:hypothetical protein
MKMANSCTTLDDPKPCFRQRRTFKKQHFFYEFFDGDTGKGLASIKQDGLLLLPI